MRGGLYDHPSDMLVGGFRWAGWQLRRGRRSGELDKGVVVNQALGKNVVFDRVCVHAANDEARTAGVMLPPS